MSLDLHESLFQYIISPIIQLTHFQRLIRLDRQGLYSGIMDGYGRIHRLRRLCGIREADVRIVDGASVAGGARQGGRLNQIESRGTV